MKSEDIILQLYALLPTKTALFSDVLAATSLTQTAKLATLTTATRHKLKTGDQITITGAVVETPVLIDRAVDVLTVVSAIDHDLTYNPTIDNDQFVILDGANEPEFVGPFKVLEVINRRTFLLITTDTGATVATGPTVAIDIDAAGYNGLKAVTVVTDFQFTYPLDQDVPSPAGGTINVHRGVRVTGVVGVERIVDIYTEQPPTDLWAFVILADVGASKDRNISNDATAAQSLSTFRQQKVIQGFSVFVVSPASEELAARQSRDSMEDIAPILFSCLLGQQFGTGFFSSKKWVTTFIGHSFELYNGAFYLHEFEFEQLAEILFEDGVGTGDGRAFRDISLNLSTTIGSEPLTASIDLDKDVLP